MSSHFTPSKEVEWYYSIGTPAIDAESAFNITFRPSLTARLHALDPTHGREALPFSPSETALRRDPAFTVWESKVFLDDTNDEWIWYQVG